jgi:hypothetical protein
VPGHLLEPAPGPHAEQDAEAEPCEPSDPIRIEFDAPIELLDHPALAGRVEREELSIIYTSRSLARSGPDSEWPRSSIGTRARAMKET